MTKGRRAGLAVAATAASLGLLWLLAGAIGARPGYDSSWHLIWAQDILSGRSPRLDSWAAPTEHPLLLGIAIIAAPFGSGAGRVLVAIELLALAVILIPAMRLMAATTGSRAAGAVAWALTVGAYGLLLAALRGYLDVFFVLLVLWAGARIATNGRPGAGALQLGLAGLLRPEAWLLSAIAALASLSRGDRSGLRSNLLATLLPPLVWFGFDAALTGKPFLSLETARTLALEGDGGGAGHVLIVSLLGGVRGPATLLGLAGLLLAWRLRGSGGIRIQLAIGIIGLVVAAAITVAGLTLLPRYMMLTWVSLSLFGGFAIAGWTGLEANLPGRREWRAAGLVVAALGVVATVALGAASRLGSEVTIDRSIGEDLSTLLAEASVRDGITCGPLTFPSFRLVPDAILELDSRSVEVRARGREPKPTSGVAVLVTGGGREVRERYSHPGIDLPVDERVPPGFRPVATAGDLTAFARCHRLSR